jgi:LysR family tcuABC transcriptional regulator
LDARQLRYFTQIVESGSLAKASRQLFIAQPALSQQMARLEEEVGRPLLLRSAQGVNPTDNGVALYHHAKFLLRQFDQAVFIAGQDAAQVSGRVSVGLAPTTVCALGLPLLAHLREKYPGVVLNVVEGMSGHIEQMARSGQLDIAVLFSQTAAAELAVEPLLEEQLYVIIPAGSTFVPQRRTTLTLREVTQIPLVLPSSSHGLRKRIAMEFERVGLSVHPVAEVDSLPLVMRSLAQGMGATIKPMSAVFALGGDAKDWRCLSISDALMQRQNYLYTLPAERLSLSAAAVRDELKEVVRQLVQSGRWQGVKLAFR